MRTSRPVIAHEPYRSVWYRTMSECVKAYRLGTVAHLVRLIESGDDYYGVGFDWA
ncbi:MAG: hypothetical protein WC114_11100 [Smithellaceae bacterium]|jgi:hypothetical protein